MVVETRSISDKPSDLAIPSVPTMEHQLSLFETEMCEVTSHLTNLTTQLSQRQQIQDAKMDDTIRRQNQMILFVVQIRLLHLASPPPYRH
jgi:hypothetical protein